MARLRTPREIARRRKFRHYAAAVRICGAAAVALVQFAGDVKPRRVCEHHLAAELTDRIGYRVTDRRLELIACPARPQEIEWFRPLQRDYSPALELADTQLVNRAPTERSWDDSETKERRRRGGDSSA